MPKRENQKKAENFKLNIPSAHILRTRAALFILKDIREIFSKKTPETEIPNFSQTASIIVKIFSAKPKLGLRMFRLRNKGPSAAYRKFLNSLAVYIETHTEKKGVKQTTEAI